MTPHRFIQRLEEGRAQMGLPSLSPAIQKNLAAYQAVLFKWNSKINLTAHRTEESSLEKNFLDSLALLPLVGDGKIMDFGSGAGFPGLVLKVCRPELSFTLVESDQRKSAFLSAVVRELKLQDIQVENRFLDAFKIRELGWEDRFDAIVSRATMALPDLLTLLAPVLKGVGKFSGMTGGEKSLSDDLVLPSSIILEAEHLYELPFSKLKRKILIFKKALLRK